MVDPTDRNAIIDSYNENSCRVITGDRKGNVAVWRIIERPPYVIIIFEV